MSISSAPDSASGGNAALAMVSQSFPPRIRKAMNALIAGIALAEIAKRRWVWATNRMQYVVTIPQEDRLYDATMEWLVSSLPKDSQRSLRVRTTERTPSAPSP